MTAAAAAHIAVVDGWPLLDGNPIPYLNGLRDGTNDESVYPADRIPYPLGKFRFDRFVMESGARAPHTIARIVNGEVAAETSATALCIAGFVKTLPVGSYFCKPDNGGNGLGAMPLDVSPSEIRVDGTGRSLAWIETLLSSSDYVVQVSLVPLQHPQIARFNAEVINTLRLVTYDTDAGPRAAGAMMRLANDAAVDNLAAGGVAVAVDRAAGVLQKTGIGKGRRWTGEVHAKSGLRFCGNPVPFLKEAEATACALHARLGVKTVGWDIALLQDGPCIVEANRDWGVTTMPRIIPGFLDRFLEFHLPQPQDASLRLKLYGSFRKRSHVRAWLCSALGRSRVSGRVDAFTDDGLTVTLAGSRPGIDAAIARIQTAASAVQVTRMTAARGSESLRAGLDVRASFTDAQ